MLFLEQAAAGLYLVLDRGEGDEHAMAAREGPFGGSR